MLADIELADILTSTGLYIIMIIGDLHPFKDQWMVEGQCAQDCVWIEAWEDRGG